MKKVILTTFFCSFITLKLFSYSGGDGTSGNPYLISSKADMEELAYNVNNGNDYYSRFFRLTRNLTGVNDIVTTVIGSDDINVRHPFWGHFDGDGHEIAVKLNAAEGNTCGVFGYIYEATISNLGVSGSITVVASASNREIKIGGICGYASTSSIINCYNKATISTSVLANIRSCVGGICGENLSGIIDMCYNNGDVISTMLDGVVYSGGICGSAGSSDAGQPKIFQCYNTGNIANIGTNLASLNATTGGICGVLMIKGDISACYNTGNIVSNPNWFSWGSGGICGKIGSNEGRINNCYNIGNVSARGYTYSIENNAAGGGICGSGGTIQNCFVAKSNINMNYNVPPLAIGRIGGQNGVYGNCYSESASVFINGVNISSQNENDAQGKDEILANLQSQSWLSSTLKWDFGSDRTWKINPNEFPTLAAFDRGLYKPDFVFRINSSRNEASLAGYFGTTGNVSIPSTITWYGKEHPVVSIHFEAFRDNKNIISVNIPSSVVLILNAAFSGCSNLSSVIMPESISVGQSVFHACVSLTSITIPPLLSGNGAIFSDCTGLTSVTIPPSVYLGGSAFTNCTGLTSATILSPVIGPGDFRDCVNLESVLFSNSLTHIYSWAFWNCKKISFIDIPNSVTEIEEQAFRSTGLKNVIVHWPTPLSVSVFWSAFLQTDIAACTLHVPAGTKALYQAAAVWRDFGTIVEQQATGIQPVIQEEEKVTEYYDLLGRRVIHPQKGQLYITNHRKIILYK